MIYKRKFEMFMITTIKAIAANAIAVNTTANKRAGAFDGGMGWGIKI